ncbi:hypothetical protein P3T36_004110 [Kitasatospora sp. MAP12-15]|nr:hypothetical protein [Kitasatospora sp. MAP12-44]
MTRPVPPHPTGTDLLVLHALRDPGREQAAASRHRSVVSRSRSKGSGSRTLVPNGCGPSTRV